jgi:general secretion pathway protein A
MLSNLETEKSKLMQIVLVGQPDLRDSLDRPSLEQLRQRVTVRYHLGRLESDETACYINHRLKRAAMAAPLEFPPEVTDIVHGRSGGVPRMINVICDAVLMLGYAEDSRVIHKALAQEAIAELESSTVLRRADTAVAPLQTAPGAHPRTPAPVPLPTPRPEPAPAVSRMDLPLRPPAVAPSFAEQPHRQPSVFVRTADPRRDGVRVQTSARPFPATLAATNTSRATVPVQGIPSTQRQPTGWSWLKAFVFGLGPETGRR